MSKKVRTELNLPPQLRAKLEREAAAQGRSLNNFITYALTKYMEQQNEN